MALLERAARFAPAEAVEWLLAFDDRLHQREPRMEEEFRSLANRQALTPASLDRLSSPETPPMGVYGAGLFRVEGDEFRPAVVVTAELAGIPEPAVAVVTPIEESAVLRLVASALQGIPRAALTIVIPRPEEGYASVQSGGPMGTLGLPVWLDDGRAGALTAGHVAPTVGRRVSIDGRDAGEVVYTNHRALHQHPTATVDVAALSLDDEADIPVVPRVAGLGSAVELGVVRAHNRSGTGSAGEIVRALFDRLAIDTRGAWADLILVDRAISMPGDSGSIVVDESDLVVGQIVGGHPPAYSLVQDVDLLLAESGTKLRT